MAFDVAYNVTGKMSFLNIFLLKTDYLKDVPQLVPLMGELTNRVASSK